MIDCPICHVKNHDDARFCAECGQRLTAPGQPAQAQPEPQAPHVSAPGQGMPQSRLHSPLLSSGEPGSDAPPMETGDVNRLRQMSARVSNKEDQTVKPPESPYKNPFDPRNNQSQSQSQSQDQQARQGSEQRPKLRSPLLSGEEFDDDDPSAYEQTPPPYPTSNRGRALHSPLLGGAENQHHHSGSGGLRSPLLGGGPADNYDQDDDQDQDQSQSGGGLRSPLLGGGYHGPDRRATAADDEPYEGQDRRRPHLHSPLLHNTEAYYFDEAEEEEEPIDEDNPNVLRSPLLAAKRPLGGDRPPVKSPSSSNTQTPMRPPNSPDAMQFGSNRPAPNTSYNNLRSISSSTGAPQAPPSTSSYTSAPPAAPSQQQPAAQPAPQASPQAPFMPAPAPAPAQVASLFPDQPPSSVPPAFQNMQSAASQHSAQTAPRPNSAAAPVGRTDATTGSITGINVQPPSRSTPKSAELTAGTPLLPTEPEPEPARKAPSRLLSQDDNSNKSDYAYGGGGSARGCSPLGKLVGVVAIVMLLAKCWVLFTFCQTEWVKSAFLVVDQMLGLALIVCVIMLAFGQSER